MYLLITNMDWQGASVEEYEEYEDILKYLEKNLNEHTTIKDLNDRYQIYKVEYRLEIKPKEIVRKIELGEAD